MSGQERHSFPELRSIRRTATLRTHRRAKTDFLSQSYLTQEGVVFYAQPYEIGPYASGFIEVTVPWKDLGL